jgi:hypothetical protein
MSRRTRRNLASVAASTTRLALAVPEVVSHRMMRAALAGSTLSARDRKEFSLMGAEKVTAFYESWGAMMLESSMALARLWWSPQSWMSPRRLSSHYQDMALSMLGKGLVPIQRRASANAARLRRVRA